MYVIVNKLFLPLFAVMPVDFAKVNRYHKGVNKAIICYIGIEKKTIRVDLWWFSQFALDVYFKSTLYYTQNHIR